MFLFGFAKRERANIDASEQKALLALGVVYMAMGEKDLTEAIEKEALLEIDCNDEE